VRDRFALSQTSSDLDAAAHPSRCSLKIPGRNHAPRSIIPVSSLHRPSALTQPLQQICDADDADYRLQPNGANDAATRSTEVTNNASCLIISSDVNEVLLGQRTKAIFDQNQELLSQE